MRQALRLEINLDTLSQNLSAVKKLTTSDVCAVVKADLYGHGLGALSAFAAADEFAVSSVGEAAEVCELTGKPVNILSMPDKTVRSSYRANTYPSVSTVGDIEYVAAMKGARAVNIKLNSGMNRYGAAGEDLEALLGAVEKSDLKVKSVFSHIYDISAAGSQFDCFMSATEPFSDYIPQRHILSSNFVCLPAYMHLDMVRPGIVLYGYGHELVRSAVTAKTSVTQLREVKSGENIGYGICRIAGTKQIAVLGAGYGDGIGRIIDRSPRYVQIGENLCPVVGQICMDAMMADVSGLRVSVGDEAVILGEYYGAESAAVSCATISYEILTGHSKRAERVYTEETCG